MNDQHPPRPFGIEELYEHLKKTPYSATLLDNDYLRVEISMPYHQIDLFTLTPEAVAFLRANVKPFQGTYLLSNGLRSGTVLRLEAERLQEAELRRRKLRLLL